MTTNRWRWRWGNSMARALLLAVTLAGQWLGLGTGGKEAKAQEKFVPASPEIDRANANFVTNIYQVPESALSRTPEGVYFTSPVELLSHAGVAFPKGSSAIFQGTSRQLIVRNTADQLEKVEGYLESLLPPIPAATELPKVDVVTAAATLPAEDKQKLAELPLPAVGFVADQANELYTNVYQVPPTFLNQGGDQLAPRDPFASPEQGKVLQPAPTATEILARAGITFGEGASAVYQAAGSQLIVRNALDQMELVEAYIESLKGGGEKLIYVQALFVETAAPLFGEDEIDQKGGAAGKGKPKRKKSVTGKVGSAEEMVALLEEKNVEAAVRSGRPIMRSLLDEEQFQALLERGRKSQSWRESDSGAMFRSGQGATVLAAGERGVGVVDVVLGADDIAIDLSLKVQRGFVWEDGKPRPHVVDARVHLSDGQTQVFAHEPGEGRYRYDFVTVGVKDPAGMPYHRPKEKEAEMQGESGGKKQAQETGRVEGGKIDGPLSSDEMVRVKAADELALRGNRMMAEQRFADSRDCFMQALEKLPDAELTRDRQRAYLMQFLAALRAVSEGK